jgi:hypothetical protein
MRNLKHTRTKIFPSTTRGGKELPSSSALDLPSVLSKLVTPTPVINVYMTQVIDDATSAMNDAYDDTTTLLHHPFLFKGKNNASSRISRVNFWRRCRGA